MIVRFWPPTRTITSSPIFFSSMSPRSAKGRGSRRVAVPFSPESSCDSSS